MSRIIKVRNLLDNQANYSYLNSVHSAGSTALNVKNTDSFFASWAIQLGKTGEERSEIQMIGTATPATGTISITGTTRFDHPTDTQVFATKYNQIIFKRSTAGTSGTATELTGGTITITPDSEFTLFDDTSGAATYAYRVAYKNSVTGSVSSDSDWMTSAGFDFYSLAGMRQRVKRKLFDSSFLENDIQIDDWTNEWLEKMNNVAIDVNKDYSIGTVDVAVGTSGLGTITSTNFKEVRRVWFTTNSSDYYKASKKSMIEFAPNDTYSETHPYYYMQGDNVIGKLPATQGTARLVYYTLPTRLSNDTDLLPISMRGYTKSFVDYALGEASYLDNKDSLGDRYSSKSEIELNKFRNEIAPRSKSGPQYITMTDTIDGDDTFELVF